MVYYKDEAWRRWDARPGEETLMGTGILLCGLNGAGKSTLGKALAEKLSFHYIDNEELYFPKNDPAYLYAVQRDREEVERLLLEETADHPDFVFTSVKGDYSEAVRARFQYAVWVDAPRELRLRRVRERSYQKFGDRMLPGGELYEQEEAFFRFVSGRAEDTVEKWLRFFSGPVLRVDGREPVEKSVERIQAWIWPESTAPAR